jgi:hypothetical protein
MVGCMKAHEILARFLADLGPARLRTPGTLVFLTSTR